VTATKQVSVTTIGFHRRSDVETANLAARHQNAVVVDSTVALSRLVQYAVLRC